MIKVGLYFQLVGQDLIWYEAMHIQPSAALRDGGWEALAEDFGCKTLENKAGVKYYSVNLNWQPRCLGLRSTALRFGPAPLFLVSPTNEMVSSCCTHESAVWLWLQQQGGARPTSFFFFLCVRMVYLRDILPQWPDLRQLLRPSKKFREPKQLVSPQWCNHAVNP